MTPNTSDTNIDQIIDKLDQVKLELMKLRATLIPEEKPTPEEKQAIKEARKEIKEGNAINLEKLIDELG